jgi:predicted negative regulator of RcsB-dependent stress response
MKLLKEQNYFDVLGVHWSAHYRTYPAAYAKAKTRFDVTRGELRDAPPELVEICKKAIETIDVAYRLLMNEQERIKYRKQLFDATEREYSADMLVKQGEVLLLRGDRIGGIEAFETAVELAPSARNRSMLAQAREGRTL